MVLLRFTQIGVPSQQIQRALSRVDRGVLDVHEGSARQRQDWRQNPRQS
jgi:hypothetical protein